MAIAAIIAAAEAEAAAAAAAAATAAQTAAATAAAQTAATTAAAGASGLGAGAGALGSMTGTGAGLAGSAAMAPEALALQSLTAPGSLTGIMGGQGAMAPVEGIMQGAQAAQAAAPIVESAAPIAESAGAAQTAGLDAAKQQLISANPASNLSYPMPDTMPPMANPYGSFTSSAGTSPVDPASAYNRNIFSGAPPPDAANLTQASGLHSGMDPAEIARQQGLSRGYTRTEVIPQGGSAEIGAGSMKTGLEAGFEKALLFAKDNPMMTISGLQMLDRAFAPGQPKKRAFNPGFSLSPNFQPTLAPSAPSGPYGRRMAEGGIASSAMQPSYEPNVSRFAQGGIARYATGGKTFGEQMAERMAAQADAPVAKETATKSTTPTASLPNASAVVEKALGLAPGTATLPQIIAANNAYKAGQPITAATLGATTSTGIVGPATPAGFVSTNPVSTNVPAFTVSSTPVANTTNTTTGGGTTTTGGGVAPGTGGSGVKPMTVADLYTRYFGREADPGGLASWTAQFGSEVDPTELQTFLNAQSTKDEMAALSGTTKPVTNTTTPVKTDPNVNPLSTNTAGTSGTYAHDMQGNIYNTATGVRVTQEEAARAAQPAYDINALYRKYLDRNADESGIKTYDPSKYTAQQVSDYLMGSEEYKKQTLDPDEIQNAYRRVLQRDVDPSGASGYLGQNYSTGAFEDFLKQSKEYKEEVPFRTMERTVYKPEYEDYTKNPLTPGIATPTTLSYDAIQSQIGHAPTLKEIGTASNAFEANKPTTADQYMAMSAKGEKGMAKGGKTSETNLYRALSASGDEVTKADMDAITAYHQHAGQLAEDDDVDTRLLDPYSAAQMRLAKLSKKNKMAMTPVAKTNVDPANMAQGGITQNLGSYSDGGHLLKGPGDGMSDHIPAMIGKHQPARLADGEFVIPADVVSHLGNGSTEAGAKQLYAMMSRIRKARTGNPKQGKQVNPRKLMPK